MAFDPNKPVAGSEIDATELRNQFNALKALIDAQAAQIATLTQQLAGLPTMNQVNAAIIANSAGSVNGVPYGPTVISDPPTQAEVQQIAYYINDLLDTMKR